MLTKIKAFSPVSRLVARFHKAREGVAAVEFALILPIMVTLFVGAVELSQAVTVDRRVTQVANTTGDLIARAEKGIPTSEINDIMLVGKYLMKPYKQENINITITAVMSSSSDATQGNVSWKCTYAGTDAAANCVCYNPGTQPYTIKPGLTGTSDTVIVSEAKYNYVPYVFAEKFMYASRGGGSPFAINEEVYLKPRGVCPELEGMTRPNGDACKC